MFNTIQNRTKWYCMHCMHEHIVQAESELLHLIFLFDTRKFWLLLLVTKKSKSFISIKSKLRPTQIIFELNVLKIGDNNIFKRYFSSVCQTLNKKKLHLCCKAFFNNKKRFSHFKANFLCFINEKINILATLAKS